MPEAHRGLAYEAILFDFDGVLADTEPLHWEAWRDAVAPLGINLTWEVYRTQMIGVSDRDVVAFLARMAQPPLPTETIWNRFADKQRLFLEKALANPPLPPANSELLRQLDSLKLALVTSTSIREIEPLLRAAGILQRFHTIVAAEDVQHPKPHPEPYLLAARRLGARRALAVEDSEAGEAAARAAGLDVLRVGSAVELPSALSRRLGRGWGNE
ncbi:MAG: HAD family hydrolase [Bryobacteraceae bacterium]